MNFLEVFKHLLPRARAWTLIIDKLLRNFFEGLAKSLGMPTRDFLDGIWLDIFPQSTRELEKWEVQFGLASVSITEQERRDRLDGAWKGLGGQSPRYLQDTLQDNGFDVYIHEWWVPGTDPPDVRNPFDVIDNAAGPTFIVLCGEPLALCGEAEAQAGNSIDPMGYLLVNKIFTTRHDFVVICGEPAALCGEPGVQAGNYTGFVEFQIKYSIPTDPGFWPYILYFGGEVFGTQATVPVNRRDEFEDLLLKICPAQQWLGIMVDFV